MRRTSSGELETLLGEGMQLGQAFGVAVKVALRV
jgi:hypothetical protein